MPSRWWYVVAVGTVAWAALLLVAGVPDGSLPSLAADGVVLVALLAWPAIPVALYLDRRAIADEVVWDPRTRLWLLLGSIPIIDVSVGAAYCLRRVSAMRGTVPSRRWYYATAVGVVAWTGTVAVDVLDERMALGVVGDVVFGPALWLLWFGFPVAIYLDAVRAEAYLPEFDPRIEGVVALSVVPVVNLLVGWVYLGGRWWAGHNGEVRDEPAVGDVDGEGTTTERISPWYRRAVVVYVGYVLAVAALGALAGLESDLSFNVLALLVWPPFGIAFVACFHYDQRALAAAGLEWGRTRLVYYLCVVIPALAFWYLIWRGVKVQRARRNDLLDVGGVGGDGEAGDGSNGRDGGPGSDGGRDAGDDWVGDSDDWGSDSDGWGTDDDRSREDLASDGDGGDDDADDDVSWGVTE